MDRRTFMSAASAAVLTQTIHPIAFGAESKAASLKPMALGLLVSPYGKPEEIIRRVHDLGFTNCFLSLDGYIGGFTPAIASQMKDLLAKYEVTATTVEVVGPPPLEWNFLRGPSTIGLVPPATRRSAHRRSAPGFGLREAAGCVAGADPLRLHPRRSGGRALSGNG